MLIHGKDGVRDTMRNPEAVLSSLRTHSKDKNYRYERVYRLLYNEELYYAAYQSIYATAIGRPDARFHDMRHSYAVAAIRSGDDIKTVQGNLGHATASFTLDVYGHVTDQMKQDSAKRMDRYIEQVMGQ